MLCISFNFVRLHSEQSGKEPLTWGKGKFCTEIVSHSRERDLLGWSSNSISGTTEKFWFRGRKTQFWGLMPFIWNFPLTGDITDKNNLPEFQHAYSSPPQFSASAPLSDNLPQAGDIKVLRLPILEHQYRSLSEISALMLFKPTPVKLSRTFQKAAVKNKADHFPVVKI